MRTEEEKRQAHREAQKRYRENSGYDKSEKQKKMERNWQKKNLKYFGFNFNRNSDSDVLEKLNHVENIAKYIKRLVLSDIGINDVEEYM